MILRCLISYTALDGTVYVAGEAYQVEPGVGLELFLAAPGYFEADPYIADPRGREVDEPPADRQVGEPPAGGAPRTRRR